MGIAGLSYGEGSTYDSALFCSQPEDTSRTRAPRWTRGLRKVMHAFCLSWPMFATVQVEELLFQGRNYHRTGRAPACSTARMNFSFRGVNHFIHHGNPGNGGCVFPCCAAMVTAL